MNFQRTVLILFFQLFLVGISSCSLGKLLKLSSNFTQHGNSKLIFPGTKWCGLGNISSNARELGYYKQTDACCRTHDECADSIKPEKTKHGLTNNALHERLHCSCEDEFLRCLRKSTDYAGWMFGSLYFDKLKMKCYREDYPIKNCERRSLLGSRCLKYKLDETKPKKWQFFDVPGYFSW